MSIPKFTSFGILPEGIHECSLEDAEGFFVKDGRRRNLWGQFKLFLNWITPMDFIEYVYIDGSFLTDKPNPNDIDIVLEIKPTGSLDMAKVSPNIFNHNYIFDKFKLDVYLCPKFLPENHNDLRDFFQYIGIKEGLKRGLDPKDKKGIIKVLL